MKRKNLKLLSIILSGAMIFGTVLPTSAYNLDENNNSVKSVEYQNNEDENFTNDVNVYAELASVYKVTIPKYMVLSGISKKANYKIKVDGDIAGYENITVIPDEKVNLYSKNKNMQIGSVKQDKTVWQVSNFNTDANGSVYAKGITAGKWTGTFNFNLNFTTEKVAGDIIIPEDQWSDTEMDISLKLGESKLVKTFGNVKLLSSNNDVVSVEGNKLNALKVGESKVTLTNENASNNQILNVEVTKAINDVHIHTAGNTVKENEVKATCETAGSYDEVTYCITCEEELSRVTKTVEATGHTLASKIIEDTNATCVKEGVRKEQDYCTVCGKEFEVKTTTIQALGHKYDEGKVTDNSTCIKEGVKTYTCTVCGDTKTEAISKASHTEGSFATTKQPTCEEKGIQTKSCTVCGAILEEKEIAAIGHSAKAAVKENNVAPTCEKDGSYDEVVYCGTCNEELSRTKKTVAKLGHDYKATIIKPTCTAKGYTLHTCSRCNNSYKDTETTMIEHTWKTSVTNNATCETDSLEAYVCTVCSETKITHNTKATGHIADTSKDVVKAATCTAQGYTTHTCKNCGKTFTDNPVKELGHNYVNGRCTRCQDFDMSKMEAGLYTVSGTGENKTYTQTVSWQQMLNNGWFKVENGTLLQQGINATKNTSQYKNDIKGFLVISSDITSFNSDTFRNLDKITGIYIPASITRIANNSTTYWFCDIENIILDKNNKSFVLENGALYTSDYKTLYVTEKNKTGTFYINDKCEIVGPQAFYSSNFEAVIIPEGTKKLYGSTFRAMPNLKSLNIPKNVDSVDGSMVVAANSLTEINVDSNNKYFTSSDGILFAKDMKTLICCPGGKGGEYVIPDTVQTLKASSFDCNRNLTKVTIPESVTSIGDWSFANMGKLTSVNIPSKVTRIGNGVFENYDGDIVISKNIKSIGIRNFRRNNRKVIFEDTQTPWTLTVQGTGDVINGQKTLTYTPNAEDNNNMFRTYIYYNWTKQ